MKNFKICAAFAILLAAVPSSGLALTLDDAKARGLVGEMLTGYLGAIEPSAEVKALVQQINGERRSHYNQIASKNGTSLQAVELLAGKKAAEETTTGNFVQSASGNWIRK